MLVYPAVAWAQDSLPPATATKATELEELRQEVQSLAGTVKALQQQVKDQQALIEKSHSGTVSSEKQTAETPAPESSPAPDLAAPPFPTEDSSVVASASPAAPAVDANGTATGGAFPTTDDSVVTSASDAPVSGGGSSLTAPITIGGGKNYMNISLDGMFVLAGSSAPDLDRIEVGDHDPQQRGFNARNIELALDGAVDPYFEGFANIVFKLDNHNETEVEVEEAFLQTTTLPFNLQLKG